MKRSRLRSLLIGLAFLILFQPGPGSAQQTAHEAKVALGLRLFFDPRLSGDNRLSCAGCHIPERAYTDGKARAVGKNGRVLARNTPTLLHSVNSKNLFWDGRVRTLEEQVREPLRHPDEMDQDLEELVVEVGRDPEYVGLFQKAFGSTVNLQGIASAIAAFERTLLTQNSPFDRFLTGDRNAIGPEARRGMGIFQTKGQCAFCHTGLDFTDHEFHNLGVPETDPKNPDLGRYLVTRRKQDRGAFKTPTLRNIAQTAPYMHNGVFGALEEVVAFYNQGGGRNANRDPAMIPLKLTREEQQDLAAFLKTLTGQLPTVTSPSK